MSPPPSVLIANRGEIAIRICRAARKIGLRSFAVYSEDDHNSPHLKLADATCCLAGSGPQAYLNIADIIQKAQEYQCDMIHPGYGFLSENADMAEACAQAQLTFVGCAPGTLKLFGDKGKARLLAQQLGIPVLPGTNNLSLEQAHDFCQEMTDSTGHMHPLMIKASAGGGGRGIHKLEQIEQLPELWKQCQREAQQAFGSTELYLEQMALNARHLEVQLVGDGQHVIHVWDRECSLQRRQQKLIEIAPALPFDTHLREEMFKYALLLGEKTHLKGLATIEFLLYPEANGYQLVFMEANPRIQVEHPVTEAICQLDLVAMQLQIAQGRTLDALALTQAPADLKGCAIELRINSEQQLQDGSLRPSNEPITHFQPPMGPYVRLDGALEIGYQTNPRFDSLLCKVILYNPEGDPLALIKQAQNVLSELEISGPATNIDFLKALLASPKIASGQWHCQLIEELMPELTFAEPAHTPSTPSNGFQLDPNDQIAPMSGTVFSLEVTEGTEIEAGQSLLILEAMKMEHVIHASESGRLQKWHVHKGDQIQTGDPLYQLATNHTGPGPQTSGNTSTQVAEQDLDRIRPDLQQLQERQAWLLDENRPDAVAKRRKTRQRTARENINDLCDAGTYMEYGGLAIAAQRRRRSEQELIERTPADGMLAGIGTVNADLFADQSDPINCHCILMSYDYTVLAGTQGQQNHRKKDRLFELAHRLLAPVVLFAEGGGGRPGDTDGGLGTTGLDCLAFQYFAALSGKVPLVGIVSGRCFAGNAALLGCCDVIIATENANIGMGGPAMIEGGGLGRFSPEEIGPIDVQTANGVVDISVKDEAQATETARHYLSYFQGPVSQFTCADQRLLRNLIPENRRRAYDIRQVIDTFSDTASVLELRPQFGLGMITALARLEGKPIGIMANNPMHQGGAIDSESADKASRFMRLCNAFQIPILMLCDTPGILVGPEAEKTALVRHAARLFVTGASLKIPFVTIVLRKGYGLGAQAMAGGSFKAPLLTAAWPTAEFGGMGLEGAVQLGFRRELEAEKDPEKRQQLYQTMVDRMYEKGRALNVASYFEIDQVIDPADSRLWVNRAFLAARQVPADPDAYSGPIDPW
ncbi:MAG: carboxyl transferase domain-containing protein [Gammaproteobacteria bacterium]